MKCKLDERTPWVYQCYIARETKGLTNDGVWVGLAPWHSPSSSVPVVDTEPRDSQGTEQSVEIETWCMPSQFVFSELGWTVMWISYSARVLRKLVWEMNCQAAHATREQTVSMTLQDPALVSTGFFLCPFLLENSPRFYPWPSTHAFNSLSLPLIHCHLSIFTFLWITFKFMCP